MKRFLSVFLATVICLSFIPLSNEAFDNVSITASAVSTSEVKTKLDQLITQFPAGKYWNGRNYDAVTSTPCTHHGSCDFGGGCWCNNFDGAIQCFGFGRMIIYKLFGKSNGSYRNWYYNGNSRVGMKTIKSISSFSASEVKSLLSSARPGDVLQFDSSRQHTMIVYSVESDGVYIYDCNTSGSCNIRFSKLSFGNWSGRNSSKLTLLRADNYDNVQPTVTLTPDSKYSSFKGFKAYPCTSEHFYCYNSDLATSPGRIYTTDYCTINDVYTNGWCKVSCPWSDGTTKTVYTEISNFIKTPSTAISSFTSQSYINLYSTSSMNTKLFRVYPGDVCYKIGSSGSATQIFMPHSNGYFVLGWIPTSELPSSNSYEVDNRYPTPFKCRVLSSSKVPAAYSVNGERLSDTNVYVDDDCVITEVYKNGWCKFTCPWSDGTTKTLYLPLKEFINVNPNFAPYTFTAPQYTVTYWKSDKASNVGWIDVGDTVTVVSKNGGVSQVIYPADVGKRCAWADTAALEKRYTVTYNANGGTGAPSSQTKTNGTGLTLSATKPTYPGHTFLGWATSSTATSAQYTAGSVYTDDANVTLYAVWKKISYTIQYNANGGSNPPSSQEKEHGTNVNISSTVPTKEGFVFDGWNTDAYGEGTSYNSGSVYSSNANVTLYAQWAPVGATSLAISAMPNKTVYKVGEDFDPTGLILTATMSNNTTKTVSEGFEYLVETFTQVGTQEIAILYMGRTVSLNVTVLSDKDPAIITVGSKSASIGGNFSLNIDISNNPGIIATRLMISYDNSKLILNSVSDGGLFGRETMMAGNDITEIPYTVIWEDGLSTTNYSENGTILTLNFTVSDNAPIGTTPITVTYDSGSTFDCELEPVEFSIVNGTIEITDRTPGDANDDGVVDLKDVAYIRRWVAEWDVTINEANSDVNGDGIVNLKDVALIRRYIAGGWNVILM